MADDAKEDPAEDEVADDADADEEGGEDGEEGEESGGRKLSRKKLILLAGIPVLLLLLAGGAFMGGFISLPGGGEEHAEVEEGPPPEVHFFDLPEMLVNLNTGSNKSTFLKVKVSLEIEGLEAVAALENLLPRVLDNFQVYLRELRVEDLNGSAGLFRLKQELLMRINRAVDPIRVTDVLFREILIQ